jgi:hypothetical protein
MISRREAEGRAIKVTASIANNDKRAFKVRAIIADNDKQAGS